MALQLRPNCEYCGKDLALDAADAMICTYECTFCADCVKEHLHNVCPNCGGGFSFRPIRPSVARQPGVGLPHQPASDKRVHLKHSKHEVAAFAASLKNVPPANR